MPRVRVVRESPVRRTPRVMQMEGMFDMVAASTSRVEWDCELPLDEREWSIGLIVGPSGCGKSTIARELFPDQVMDGFEWDDGSSLLDGFPEGMGVREIVELLSSVGFSSPPEWLRPYHVLSTGQRFRVNMARALAESADLTVMDEFTSVVDRRVAQIGSAAVAKAVRRTGRRFVAVSCHDDIEEWLQPDWVFNPQDELFRWRSVQRRPEVEIVVRRVDKAAWRIFSKYHYLTHKLNASSQCWLGTIEGEPVVFVSVLHQTIKTGRHAWRLSRVVCLPDYQGLGLGNAVFDLVASFYAASKQTRFVASHPALIQRAARSTDWDMVRKPGFIRTSKWTRTSKLPKEIFRGTTSQDRRTASCVWVGRRYPRAMQAGEVMDTR